MRPLQHVVYFTGFRMNDSIDTFISANKREYKLAAAIELLHEASVIHDLHGYSKEIYQ